MFLDKNIFYVSDPCLVDLPACVSLCEDNVCVVKQCIVLAMHDALFVCTDILNRIRQCYFFCFMNENMFICVMFVLFLASYQCCLMAVV